MKCCFAQPTPWNQWLLAFFACFRIVFSEPATLLKSFSKLKNVSKFYYNKGVIASGFNKVSIEFDLQEFDQTMLNYLH